MTESYDGQLEEKDRLERQLEGLLVQLETKVSDTITATASFNEELVKAEHEDLFHIARKVVEYNNLIRKTRDKLFEKDLAHDYT